MNKPPSTWQFFVTCWRALGGWWMVLYALTVGFGSTRIAIWLWPESFAARFAFVAIMCASCGLVYSYKSIKRWLE